VGAPPVGEAEALVVEDLSHQEADTVGAAHCLPMADAGDGVQFLQGAVDVVTQCPQEEEVEEDEAAYLQAGVDDQVDIAHSHLEADAALGGVIPRLLENVPPYPREDVVQIFPPYPQVAEVARCLLEGIAEEVDETAYHFHQDVVGVGDVRVLSH